MTDLPVGLWGRDFHSSEPGAPGMSMPGGHSPGLLGTYFFQNASTAFILRRLSVVT